MSRNRVHLDSWEWDKLHREKVIKKVDKIKGYEALIAEWEASPNPDHDYLLELRRKLRCAQNQFAAMKP